MRAWPVALSTLMYFGILLVAYRLASPFGTQIGGFIVGFVQALCISSYLYLVSRAVDGSKLRFVDLKQSFLALLWDVVGVLFALWVGGLVIGLLAEALGDHGPFVRAAWGLAVAVLLNPVPELIYQGRAPGRTTELLLESVRFVQSHWIEWFVPNLLFGLGLLALSLGREALDVRTLTGTLPAMFSLHGAFLLSASLLGGSEYWKWPFVLALAHIAMVFRGLLFRELVSGNWRTRAFRSWNR
jgi:hypothetical protein